jgi:hypothetical protein
VEVVRLAVGRAPEGLDRTSASVPGTVGVADPSLAAGLPLANSLQEVGARLARFGDLADLDGPESSIFDVLDRAL